MQSGPKLKPWPVGAHLWREPRRRWAGWPLHWPCLTSCARAGPLLAPISCLARAITPRAPSADRLRGAIGATQNTLQSLSCRGQYGCSVVKGVPPAPDCPCIALASCLARAAHGLTDPHVHAQTTSEFLRQPELSAPVGGRALGRRSEGSLLAAELLRAGLEPGVQPLCRLDGLMPVQPCPRCAHPRCPSPRAMGHPKPPCLTTNNTCVPRFVPVSTRAFERGAVRLLGTRFWS